ncbi:MAG: hypothetical protein K2O39_03315, partial [Clostridiales bacterium]|nr:hypothetical protein [Clostridiales bacterium]
DYYTVEYTPVGGTTTRYISTYDGSTSGDDTLANKATSGVAYTSASGAVAGAFKYLDTIEVPSAIASGTPASGDTVTYQTVYVPMSYFGLLSTLVGAKTSDPDKGKVEYPTDVYVGYELAKNTAVDLNNINQILACMTLSDGTYEWRGTDIKNNPYVTIGAFDWYHDDNEATNSARLASDPYSSPYYNNRLAVVTKNPNDNTPIGYEQYDDNNKSIVGDAKMLMYLEDQATKLIEHNFGLTFTKKNVRTSTRSLSFTINLARYTGNMVALTNGEIAKNDRRTVELKIHVENSKLDLYNAADNSSPVKYDTEQGTYYMDLELKSSESATYTLSRKAVGQNPSSDAHTIEYYDDDYGTADKRDYAYFSSDSFMQLSQWQVGAAGYNRAMQLPDDNKFQN